MKTIPAILLFIIISAFGALGILRLTEGTPAAAAVTPTVEKNVYHNGDRLRGWTFEEICYNGIVYISYDRSITPKYAPGRNAPMECEK